MRSPVLFRNIIIVNLCVLFISCGAHESAGIGAEQETALSDKTARAEEIPTDLPPYPLPSTLPISPTAEIPTSEAWITPPPGILLRDIIHPMHSNAQRLINVVFTESSRLDSQNTNKEKMITLSSIEISTSRSALVKSLDLHVDRVDTVFGRSSYKQEWLAASVSDSKQSHLHVASLNNEDQKDIDLGAVAPADPTGCLRSFSWSPAENRIVYKQYIHQEDTNREGFVFYLYRPTSNEKEGNTVGFRNWADLVGWLDEAHVLIISRADFNSKPIVESVNVHSGKHTAVATIPSNQTLYCEILSPKGRNLFIRTDSQAFVIDLNSGIVHELAYSKGEQVFWADEKTLLTFPSAGGDTIDVVYSEESTSTSQKVILPLSYRNTSLISLLDVSPDGAMLALCEGNLVDQGVRNWLYDVYGNAWLRLPDATYCVSIIGWVSS